MAEKRANSSNEIEPYIDIKCAAFVTIKLIGFPAAKMMNRIEEKKTVISINLMGKQTQTNFVLTFCLFYPIVLASTLFSEQINLIT